MGGSGNGKGMRRALLGPRARILVAAWLAFSFPRAGLAVTFVKPGGFVLAMASRLESVEKGAGQDVPVPTAVNVGGSSGGGDPVPELDPLTSLKLADALQAAILLADADSGGAAGSGTASGDGTAPQRAPGKKKKAKWGLPPFRLWGNLSNYTSVSRSVGSPSSMTNTTQVSLSASSFIWQPWFAPVTGTLGFNYAKSKSGPSKSDSTYLTGSGSLSLLPESRFPFEANADVSDTSTGGDVVGSGYRSTRIGLRQSYRPLVGNSRYSVSFDRSVLDSPTSGKDVQNALTGTAGFAVGSQGLGIDGSIVRNRVATGANSEFINLTARHSYTPAGRWSLNSMASTSRGESHVSTSDISQRFSQFVSTASWTPATERPMFVIGNLRYFDSEVSAGTAGTYSTRTASLYGGLAYELAKNVRLSVGASYTTGSNLTMSGTTGISYGSDPIKMGKFDYSWNTGVSVGSQTGSDDSALQRTGSLGHGLSRAFELGPASSLSLRLSQSAGVSEGRTYSKSLSHGLGIGWNRSLESGNLSVSANASDSRNFRGDPRGQQLVNLQGTFDSPLSRYSTLSGNMTLQGTRPLTVADQPGFDVTTGANISYSNQRLLDVRNLRFSSELAANNQQLADRFGGTIGATPGNRGSFWDNRIDYTLGLLSFRGSARLTRTDGRNNESFFFSVSRPFGDM
jgi:hypothetical protein